MRALRGILIAPLLAGCQTDIGAVASGDLASRESVDLAESAPPDGGGAGDLAAAMNQDASPPLPEQLPPTRRAELDAWLAQGHYTRWRCEPAPHDARPPGAHGRNRICSNEALATAGGAGEFPVGAASVKELWDGAAVRGFAVAVRVAPGGGGSGWYWYERAGSSVFADGLGPPLCTGCHSGAARDFVFTVVR